MSPMPATSSIANALQQIASALLIPVLVLALIALLLCALEAGRFAGEAWRRRRAGRSALRSQVGAIIDEPARATQLAPRAPSALAEATLIAIGKALAAGEPERVTPALAEFELAVQRRLERARVLVRAGPALGLMGTLIPLAPGLAALARGDAATLASDLSTAFAATTIGLLVGTVAFAITLIRTRMYAEDLAALEAFETAEPALAAVAPQAADVAGGRT